MTSQGFDELCGSESDSAANGMDEHVFSSVESCLSQRVVCGYEDLGNSARRRPFEFDGTAANAS
jgi:hypothetical protein